jgi:hypothetical protein
MLTQLRVPHVGRTRIENIMSRSPKIRKTSKSVIALLLIDVVSRREFQDGKTYEGLLRVRVTAANNFVFALGIYEDDKLFFDS